MGIKKYGWRKNRNGFPNAGFGLHLFPRDMAKIGQMFLDSGVWNGTQVVSKDWVKESTSRRVDVQDGSPGVGYGYQWWVRRWSIEGKVIDTFQAQGNGGQVICVAPSLNIVIVLTGAFYDEEGGTPYVFLERSLLPALVD